MRLIEEALKELREQNEVIYDSDIENAALDKLNDLMIGFEMNGIVVQSWYDWDGINDIEEDFVVEEVETNGDVAYLHCNGSHDWRAVLEVPFEMLGVDMFNMPKEDCLKTIETWTVDQVDKVLCDYSWEKAGDEDRIYNDYVPEDD